MEIDDKGGEVVQRYGGEDCKVGEIRYKRNKGWTWTKREQH